MKVCCNITNSSSFMIFMRNKIIIKVISIALLMLMLRFMKQGRMLMRLLMKRK